jgi:DNA topoisomerase IB
VEGESGCSHIFGLFKELHFTLRALMEIPEPVCGELLILGKSVIRHTQVAKQLGNTVAICRKCYIHPAVISSYHCGSLRNSLQNANRRISGIWVAEARVRRLLANPPSGAFARRNGNRRHMSAHEGFSIVGR